MNRTEAIEILVAHAFPRDVAERIVAANERQGLPLTHVEGYSTWTYNVYSFGRRIDTVQADSKDDACRKVSERFGYHTDDLAARLAPRDEQRPLTAAILATGPL